MEELIQNYSNIGEEPDTPTPSPQLLKRKRAKLGMGTKTEDSDHQETPPDLYNNLHAEFNFDFDPCPLHGELKFDGLLIDWGKSNFVNPPWSDIARWVIKAREECIKGNQSVLLVPCRMNAAYWHNYILNTCSEIRFIKGRVAFGEYIKLGQGAPIPLCIIVFNPSYLKTNCTSSNKLNIGKYITSVFTRKPTNPPDPHEQ